MRKRDESIQSARFIEAAKAAGADETGKEFERMFKKIVTAKKQHKTQPVMGLLLQATFLSHCRSVAV